MLNCLQHKTLIALFVIPLAMPCNAEREVIKRYPNQKAEDFTYTSRQKFKNEVYNKDNNIWAVSEKFATTFGMPKEFISQELVGIEAAAFRIEPSGFFSCGWGRNANACKMEDRCVLDIYIDENKLKLPWATNTQSGSNPARTSLRWLSTYSDGGIKASIFPEMITVESTFGVKAFMDPVTKYELGFYDSGNSDKEYSELDYIYGRFMPISNYQRNTIEGLTLLSFDRACLKSSEKHPSKFVLRTVQNGTNDPAREFPPKVYFKFLVGFGFEQRIRQVLDQHGEMNSKLYQQYWQNRSEKQ